MNKSIENIWKEGFANQEIAVPKIHALYNQKSIGMVDRIIHQFRREIWLLIPIAVFVFLLNIWLDNDNAILWGLVGSVPCLFWFFLGRRQLTSLIGIDYEANSYRYLLSIREKLYTIRRFNKRLAISSVPIILLPMIVYTYYHQKGKTIGEIFGVDGLNWPTETIFLILPVLTLLAFLIAAIFFRKATSQQMAGIDSLIHEMEELRN